MKLGPWGHHWTPISNLEACLLQDFQLCPSMGPPHWFKTVWHDFFPVACCWMHPDEYMCPSGALHAGSQLGVGQRSQRLEFSSAGLYCFHSVWPWASCSLADHQCEYINEALVPAKAFSKWKPLWFVLLWPLHSKKDVIELEKGQTMERWRAFTIRASSPIRILQPGKMESVEECNYSPSCDKVYPSCDKAVKWEQTCSSNLRILRSLEGYA